MTTDLVKLDPAAPLAKASMLTHLPPETYFQMGCSFPDPDLNEEQRVTRARGRCTEIASWVNTAKDPHKLLSCCIESWMEAITGTISVDLPATRSLGYVAFIPYGRVLTLILQYQGLGELIMRSGVVSSLDSQLVYKQDQFEVVLGSDPKIIHVPDMSAPRRIEDMTFAYTVAHHLKGPIQPEIMNRAELETVRKASKQSAGPAWRAYPGEMYRKAPSRRIAKRLKKQVGGIPQIALTRGLEIEDSQFDHSRLDRYKELVDIRDKEDLENAREAVAAPMVQIDTESRPAGWIDAKGQTMKSLKAKIAEIRKGESDLSNSEWLEQVMYNMNMAGEISDATKVTKPADGRAIWDAIVNELKFDLATGDRLPDSAAKGAAPLPPEYQ